MGNKFYYNFNLGTHPIGDMLECLEFVYGNVSKSSSILLIEHIYLFIDYL